MELASSPGKKLKLLEVGAGDGMLGVLLNAVGHEVTLCDLDDWRTEQARGLEFIAADCCARIPCEQDKFNVVCSFNTFEHLTDPSKAFKEMIRVTSDDGLLYLDFGPLYCSPWGLHAYRSIRLPYPQFLFSSTFTYAKLKKLGIFDLGAPRAELQKLNGWKPTQFSELWNRANLEIVALRLVSDEEHLNVIIEYPESFQGRGLSFQDVTCSNIIIAARKRG